MTRFYQIHKIKFRKNIFEHPPWENQSMRFIDYVFLKNNEGFLLFLNFQNGSIRIILPSQIIIRHNIRVFLKMPEFLLRNQDLTLLFSAMHLPTRSGARGHLNEGRGYRLRFQ